MRLAMILAFVIFAAPALAAEIKVLSAGAFKPVVVALVPEFEKQIGHKVTIDNDTAGGLARRITGGEAFDLVVVPPGGIEPLVKPNFCSFD